MDIDYGAKFAAPITAEAKGYARNAGMTPLGQA